MNAAVDKDLRRRLRVACETLATAPRHDVPELEVQALESAITSKTLELLNALDAAEAACARALPLLVRLGDYEGNANERCETILAIKEVLR